MTVTFIKDNRHAYSKKYPIYLYCSPVILCCHFNVIFNIAIKVQGLACHKTRFNPPFFPLKMSCTKSGIWPLLYYSSFLCVLHFNVMFLLCRSSPVIFDAFPSVLFCNLDLFFLSIDLWISNSGVLLLPFLFASMVVAMFVVRKKKRWIRVTNTSEEIVWTPRGSRLVRREGKRLLIYMHHPSNIVSLVH